MTQEKKRLREIDILKGIAIVMVLLGHSVIEFPVNLSAVSWCNYIHWFVNSVHMPLFFAISGFCFSFYGWNGYLKKKSRRILIPFLVFSIIAVVSRSLLPSMVNGPSRLGQTVVTILTGGTHWFLYTLFLIFLLFPLFKNYLESDRSGLICIAIIGLISFFSFWPALFNLVNIVRYSFFFASGYYLRCLTTRKPEIAGVLLRIVKHPATIVFGLAVWAYLTNVRIQINVAATAETAMNGKFSSEQELSGIEFLLFQFTEAWEQIRGSITTGKLISPDALAKFCAALAGIPAVVGLSMYLTNLRISHLFEVAGKDSLQLYLFNGYWLTITRWLVVTRLHIKSPVVIIAANFIVMYFVSLVIIELIVKRVRLFRTLTGMV